MSQTSTKPIGRARPWESSPDPTPPINLEVCFRTGDGCFFPYAYLTYCRYDRSGTIELHFSSWVLRIEGRHLSELYSLLKKHAVSSIQEADHDENADESLASISQVTVSEADD